MNSFDPSGELRRQHDRAVRNGLLADLGVIVALAVCAFLVIEIWVKIK